MASRNRDSGFSLLEMLTALAVVSVVLLASLTLVDGARRVTTTQSGVAEMQGNFRIAESEVVRRLHLAGLGGLRQTIPPDLADGSPAGLFPRGLALAVDNNVETGAHAGDASTPAVVAGTDMVTVRGVFSTPVYYLEPQLPVSLVDGRMTAVLQRDVDLGLVQDLEPLRKALRTAKEEDLHEAVIVRDRFNPGAYAVLELDLAATSPGSDDDPTLAIGLILGGTPGTQEYADEYGRLTLGTTLLQGAGGPQVTLPDGTVVQLPSVIGTLGLLEEYRYYVREDWEIPGDASSRPTPRLARTRFYPGTGAVHPEGTADLVDGIIDLQLALGVDLPPRDGQIVDGGDELDEVLYNHPSDDDGLDPPATGAWAVDGAQLLFVRLTVVAQARHPDREFAGVILGKIEDHDHAKTDDLSVFNRDPNHKVRKRGQQTIVEMRNLP